MQAIGIARRQFETGSKRHSLRFVGCTLIELPAAHQLHITQPLARTFHIDNCDAVTLIPIEQTIARGKFTPGVGKAEGRMIAFDKAIQKATAHNQKGNFHTDFGLMSNPVSPGKRKSSALAIEHNALAHITVCRIVAGLIQS